MSYWYSKQHFTEPPARYSEARLIKELQERESAVDLMIYDDLIRFSSRRCELRSKSQRNGK